jgi:hypothetical protein
MLRSAFIMAAQLSTVADDASFDGVEYRAAVWDRALGLLSEERADRRVFVVM